MSIEIDVKRHGYIVNDVALRPTYRKEDFQVESEYPMIRYKRDDGNLSYLQKGVAYI